MPNPFSDCVHCGLCLNACPTYLELGTETDSPRGRIYLMERVASGEIALDTDVVRHLDLCLGCRACETACPSGVRYGALIETARAQIEKEYHRPWRERWKRRLIALIFPYPRRLRLLLAPARWLDRLGLLEMLRRASATVAMLPPLSGNADERSGDPVAVQGSTRGSVQLFAGCVSQVLFAATNAATERVLRRHQYRFDPAPAQVCCGALHLHAGDRDAAMSLARRNIEAFGNSNATIVVNSAGCGAMLKDYGHLLHQDAELSERAAKFSARVQDVTELLAHDGVAVPERAMPTSVTYHDACHLIHGQGIRNQPRALLRAIAGVDLRELNEAEVCCGSAGSYNLTEPEMARRLGDRKAANIAATGAACVAVGNPGCAMQIRASLQRAGSRIEVLHPIELLDRAYATETLGPGAAVGRPPARASADFALVDHDRKA